LSLMSKPMAMTLPLILLILDFWPLGRFPAGLTKAITEKIPFFILALAGGFLAVASHAKALEPGSNTSIVFWAMNAFRSLAFYLWKLAVPIGLVPLYPFPRHPDFYYHLQNALALLWVILISVACYYFRKKAPYLAAAWLFYLVTLAPVSGFLQTGSQAAADRYTYLPSLGAFLFFSAIVTTLLSNRRLLLGILIAVLTGIMGMATVRQIGIWKNSQSLWERVTRIYPTECPEAHAYLGCVYTDSNRPDDAMAEFKTAISIPPPLPITYNGIGIALYNQGKFEEAVQAYKTALSLKPQTAVTHRNLWKALKQLGRFEEGVTVMQEALKIEPDVADNYGDLGASYGYMKKLDLANGAYERAHALDPYRTKYLENLAVIAQMQGRLDDGIAICHEGISLNPREPVYYMRLADIYKSAGKPDLALPWEEKARALAPLPDAPSE
jgi:protein O-mannosyl-transferase